jgi:hypothetical protein
MKKYNINYIITEFGAVFCKDVIKNGKMKWEPRVEYYKTLLNTLKNSTQLKGFIFWNDGGNFFVYNFDTGKFQPETTSTKYTGEYNAYSFLNQLVNKNLKEQYTNFQCDPLRNDCFNAIW